MGGPSVELTQDERDLLLEVLTEARGTLREEIYKTETGTLREQLHVRETLITQLLDKLSRLA